MRDQDFISLTSEREAKKAIKFYNRKKRVKERKSERKREACDIEKKHWKKEEKMWTVDLVINTIIILPIIFNNYCACYYCAIIIIMVT